MKHLLKHSKPYYKECLCGPLFKLIEVAFELCVPIVMKNIIDVGISSNNIRYITGMSLLLISFGLAGLVAAITAQYFSAKAAVGIVSRLKRALLNKIQSLSYSDLDSIGTSTLITRLTGDANQVQSGINLTLRLLLRSPFVVFGAMIMAFTVDAKAAMVFAVIIPILAAVVFWIMIVCLPLYKKVQERLDRVLGLTRENLSGVRVIRAFCRENEEITQFDEHCEELNTQQNKVGLISSIMNPATFVLINFAIVALIYTGALQVYYGELSQGAVVSLYNYMLLILTELIKLANLIINITKSIACEKRIEAVLDREPSMYQPLENGSLTEISDRMVEFNNVSFHYEGSSEDAISSLSFSAKKGETIGIIGGTGSGKSSIINLIPRFYDASEGSVIVGGKNVKDYTFDTLRQRIGIVPQKAVLFSGTIRENLLWGNKMATDEDLIGALTVAQAYDFVMDKEGGLDAPVEQNGRNFSGGQRQRLTIARALVRKPQILILDDSTSALDFATDAALRKAIRQLEYAPTVFIVSQRTSSIKYADKIIVLDDGRVEGIGTHNELLHSCEVYQEIHNSQFKKEAEQ